MAKINLNRSLINNYQVTLLKKKYHTYRYITVIQKIAERKMILILFELYVVRWLQVIRQWKKWKIKFFYVDQAINHFNIFFLRANEGKNYEKFHIRTYEEVFGKGKLMETFEGLTTYTYNACYWERKLKKKILKSRWIKKIYQTENVFYIYIPIVQVFIWGNYHRTRKFGCTKPSRFDDQLKRKQEK